MKKILFLFCGLLLLQIQEASAHVGSPDVVMEGMAGNYHLLVSIKPPDVIPGTAAVTVFVQNNGNTNVYARSVYFRTGDKGAPLPDKLQPVAGHPGQYQGIVWLMSSGSSSVQLSLDGAMGKGEMIVPVVAIATAQRTMPAATGYILAALGIFLFVLMLTIIGSSVSEALTRRGETLPASRKRSRLIGVFVAVVFCSLVVYGGNAWWQSETMHYKRFMFKPMHAFSRVEQQNGINQLIFTIDTVTADRKALLSYLVPDHGKIMHLFIMRIPAMDAFAHLHPVRVDSATFKTILPSLPKGKYLGFADLVYNNGFTETIKDTFDINENLTDSLHKMDSDDAYAFAIPDDVVDNPMLTNENTILCGKPGSAVKLKDGSKLVWEGGKNENLEQGQLYTLRFALYDANNQPVKPEPYLGMAGHAAVIRNDGNVYVHLHPVGTFSIAAENNLLSRIGSKEEVYKYPDRAKFRDSIDAVINKLQMMSEDERNKSLMDQMRMSAMDTMPGMQNNIIQFPYTFPTAGQYRIWVLCKRNGKILTAAFDKLVRL